MAFEKFREASRTDWGLDLKQGETLSLEQIRTGCLMRIADAADGLRISINAVMAERDRQKARADRLENQNRGLKGEITKLKKKLQEVQGQ
jgi:hypothetical protein